MKTATKPLRVPADIEEGFPTPVRVLRNGKRIRATPRLPKASRVTVSPEDAKALGGAHRVPLAQVCDKSCHTEHSPISLSPTHSSCSPASSNALDGCQPGACSSSQACFSS